MKTYQVELRRTSFINVWIDAENEEQAEALAWKEVSNFDPVNDSASWDIEYLEEVKK